MTSKHIPFWPDSRTAFAQLPEAVSSEPPTEWIELAVDPLLFLVKETDELCLESMLIVTVNQPCRTAIPVKRKVLPVHARGQGRRQTVDGLPGVGIPKHGS